MLWRKICSESKQWRHGHESRQILRHSSQSQQTRPTRPAQPRALRTDAGYQPNVRTVTEEG